MRVWQSHFSVPSWSGLVASNTSESSTFWACTVEVFKKKMIPWDQPRSSARCIAWSQQKLIWNLKKDIGKKTGVWGAHLVFFSASAPWRGTAEDGKVSSLGELDWCLKQPDGCKLPRQNYCGDGRCTSRLAPRAFLPGDVLLLRKMHL